jgi:hypothetical protein
MTKETSLFILPGLALCIWVYEEEFKICHLAFGALLFFSFSWRDSYLLFNAGPQAGESADYTGSHLESGNLQACHRPRIFFSVTRSSMYLKRYIFCIPSGPVFLLIKAKSIKMDEKVKSLIIIPLAFFVLLTIAVKSINPPVPAMSFNPRHLVPAAPFMSFIISYALIVTFGFLRKGTGNTPVAEDGEVYVRRYAGITGVLSVVSLVVVIAVLPHFPQAARSSFLGELLCVQLFSFILF